MAGDRFARTFIALALTLIAGSVVLELAGARPDPSRVAFGLAGVGWGSIALLRSYPGGRTPRTPAMVFGHLAGAGVAATGGVVLLVAGDPPPLVPVGALLVLLAVLAAIVPVCRGRRAGPVRRSA